jgi:putative transposase
MVRSRTQLAAENLFLRKQLACYIERQVRPRRTDDASRIALALLSQLVGWRELLTIVRPETLVRWHRDLFRLFWRRASPVIAGALVFPLMSSDSSRRWQ